MDPTKLAVGAGATVLAVGGSYGISALFKNIPPMPDEHTTVSENTSNFSSTYTSPKFGHAYGKYLVDPTKNQKWWEWSFNYLLSKAESLSSEFQKVKNAYSSDSNSDAHLNKVCETAFKLDKTDLEVDNKSQYLDNVWRFCSLALNKPVTIEKSQDKDSYSSPASPEKIGHKHKSTLISIKNPDNDRFWELRDKEFFEATGAKSGSQAEENSFFKKFYETNHTKKENRPSLKSKCQAAYEQEDNDSTSTETQAKTSEVTKFCAL
ncbi:hypothetical protein [Candidatus Mycoplasma haematohominis]|uniref:Uncharacterized protein n=1 Tax=Candidatus Mycoplasma haematohominis TaxID=1494318 RepID=A0A478FR71_9MOLU|nr:hypothetical protein [Candidatus Mycoplasma haemohominis]GCE63494.1 hypothetical protein MHSWG343_04910 [Candidatus Mycoplasma haemohominis]